MFNKTVDYSKPNTKSRIIDVLKQNKTVLSALLQDICKKLHTEISAIRFVFLIIPKIIRTLNLTNLRGLEITLDSIATVDDFKEKVKLTY